MAEAARLGLLLRAGLARPPGVELADGVLASLGLGSSSISLPVAAEIDLADGVLARLGLERGAVSLPEAAEIDLADGVLAQVGLGSGAVRLPEVAPVELADAALAAAGLLSGRIVVEAPAHTPALAAELDLRPPADVVPFPRPAARPAARPWRAVGPALLMAAAALLSVLVEGPWVSSDQAFTYSQSSDNRLEIIELSTETDAVVHVIQAEEDAPTIIFIDEADPQAPAAEEG